MIPSFESVAIYPVPALAQVEIPAQEVAKVSLFIVFFPCPGGVFCLRSYESVATPRVPRPAQVTKVLLFVVFPPEWATPAFHVAR